MAIETFNRYENKYRISEDVFYKLQDRMVGFIEEDAYCQAQFTYPIVSIYYDTADSYLIRTSKTQPVYKEKLRLRSYGTPAEGSTVYAEIKKKCRGLTNKRRSGLKLDEAYAFLATGNLPIWQPYMNGQVLREIQYMLSHHELHPSVYIAYDRRAFGQENAPLRVTFDSNIRTRRKDMRLEAEGGERLLPDGEWLMEIKTADAIPVWLAALLSEYKVYPNSFSKYGAEYKSSLIPNPGRQSEKVAAFYPVPAFKNMPVALASGQ